MCPGSPDKTKIKFGKGSERKMAGAAQLFWGNYASKSKANFEFWFGCRVGFKEPSRCRLHSIHTTTMPPRSAHVFCSYALRGDSKGLIELLGGAVHPYKTFSSTACHNTLTLMWVRPASCRAGIFRLRLIPFVVTPTLRTPFNELSARTISGRSFRTSGC